jgi:putative DNA primase/helicase
VPEEVKRRFVQVGRTYFFSDGAKAFEDRGRKLTTPSENTEVIRSLVAIAHSRGWEDVTVSGTERFRRSAWQEASFSGLAVRGYRPTPFEQARVIQRLARGAADAAPAPVRDEAKPVREEGRKEVAREAAPARTDALIAGELVERGRATYRFDPREEMSYYAKLRTAEGERTLWGKDLERAFEESLTQPQVGDPVGLRPSGRDRVTVKARERDEEGRVVAEKDLATHRNRWIVEKLAFFEDRKEAADILRNARVVAREGARSHPQLVSSYLSLEGAARLAERLFGDPKDRERFTELVRERLGDRIERGDPPPRVRLKERERPPRRPDRDRTAGSPER